MYLGLKMKRPKIILLITSLFLVLIGVIIFILLSYKGSIVVDPKQLPNARIGQHYEQKISIYANHPIKSIGPIRNPIIKTNFNNNGLDLSYGENNDNVIWIKGSPTQSGEYYIHIDSGFYGGGGLSVNKSFLLVVE